MLNLPPTSEGVLPGQLLEMAVRAGYIDAGRFKIPQTSDKRKKEGGIWTHPVIANGKLYILDQDLLFCYDIKAKQK